MVTPASGIPAGLHFTHNRQVCFEFVVVLNELRDEAVTTSDGRLFHMLTILQLKKFSVTPGVC